MERSTLFKECVVASLNTFIVKLEGLFSDLSYVWYITHTHTKTTPCFPNVRDLFLSSSSKFNTDIADIFLDRLLTWTQIHQF